MRACEFIFEADKTVSDPMQNLVDIDQQERNEYKKFVQDQAKGDWEKGAKLYSQLKNRPSDDVFGEKERQTQFQNMQHNFNKFTPKDWKNYWLLSQHADNNVDFQRQALTNIEKYQGQDNEHYRYLHDRIAVNTGQPQKYGTQNVPSPKPPISTKADGISGGGGSVPIGPTMGGGGGRTLHDMNPFRIPFNESSAESNVIFLSDTAAIVGQEHGKKLKLLPDEVKKIKAIANQHGAWYEGNGMDQELTKGIIDDYQGSWDDDLLSPAVKGYPAPFLYVLFSNIKENDTVKGKIGSDPNSTIFDRILDTQPSTNYFPDRTFDADTLEKFLRAVSEGPYDFVQMSQAPATEQNVAKFFKLGERLMWPDNWEEYPNRAGRVAKSVNDLRDKFLASRKRGVYVAGSDHLKVVQQFLDQTLSENFADGRVKGKSRPGRVKRAGASCKGSVTSLRQKAKKSGGERGRMYHWCANMKSGRKK